MITGDLYQSPLFHGATFEESTGDGVIPRPHWARLLDSLRDLGPEELEERWRRAERRIRDNGMTYNMYGDPLGADRPWKIDIVPLLIGAEEWRLLEAGVKQRAQLLNLLLEDLYGPQTLVKEGRFPASLLYANPAFLRPLAGVPVPAHSYLHMLAVDLARSPDGRWWVLADRTQAPSGSGYALENRSIVSDVLPELYREARVLQLTPFFRAQREVLLGMANGARQENGQAAGQRPEPRVVLLTPGPHNETYFEHSYLAKYLDFTLVEGADLTVRDRAVYLKTVGGLERVDVILRRVDDTFCDPLELRGDSLLGVSGLVEAVVAGNVTVANALGSGLIESAAIMPFLPGLSRHLLGQSLILPSVATWWCGQQSALDWVVNHLDTLVVKPSFPALGREPVFGSELPAAERAAFLARLRGNPQEYVAQEQVALSTAPVWEERGLSSRSVVLRTYALNTGKGWMVIPGGLVRVAESDGAGNGAGNGSGSGAVVSMQRGGHSKDAWVLSEAPVEEMGVPRAGGEPVKLRRVSPVVPSRVADYTFWLGRYVERAENTARVLRSLVPRVRRAEEAELGSLLRLHGCLHSPNSKLPKRKRPTFPVFEKELFSLLSDRKRWDSLPATLAAVARTGGNVRERLSADMTLLIQQLRDSMPLEPGAKLEDISGRLTGALELLSTFSGMERENLIRGSGWLFLSLGRRLERAVTLSRQLREITRPLPTEDWAYMQWLLEVEDSAMTYRQRYYTTLQPLPVLDVLLADETNPRSLNFQLAHLVDLYRKLPRHEPADLQSMQRALETLRGMDLQAMQFPATGRAVAPAKAGAAGRAGAAKDPFTGLDRSLRELTNQLFVWSDNLSSRYFSHARTLPSTVG